MSAPTLLGDPLGPRGRRRAAIATVVSVVLVAIPIWIALQRLADKGQLDADRWSFYTQPSVMRFLLGGLVGTLKAAGYAIVLAFVLGVMLALGRLARAAVVRWAAGAFVEIFRSIPLLLLILFSYLAVPTLVDAAGIQLSRFSTLVLALTAYNSAVIGEIVRAGILSLDRGQQEAASAIGLRYWQSMRLVILPQALRRMIPAIVSQLVTLLKDTALGFVISYEELLRRGMLAGEDSTPNTLLQAVLIVAAMYIVVNFLLGRAAQRLEVRQRRRYGAGAMRVGGAEDLAVLQAPR